MGDFSPVLQAFLAGQKQQTDILQTAHEIINKRTEAQQRQQTIDDVMKRFAVESKQHDERMALDHDIFQLQHKKAMSDAGQQFLENLRSGASPITPAAQQTTDSPYGQISVPTPQTNIQAEQAKQQALLPGLLEQHRQTADIDADAYVKKMMPELQAKLDSQEKEHTRALTLQQAISDAKIDALKRGQDMHEKLAEIQANSKMMSMFAMNGINPDPEAFKKQVSTVAHQAASGQVEGNLPTLFGPIIGRAAEGMLANAGFTQPPKGFAQKVMSHAVDAQAFVKSMQDLKSQLGTPTDFVGKAGNYLATKTGVSSFSPYASLFNDFQLSVTPGLESALGISVKGASRSKQMLDTMKQLTPSPTDTSKVFDEKVAHGLDLHLTGAAKDLSGLNIEQRKMFWQRFIDEAPEILHNSTIGPKVVNAAHTGLYSPGLK